MMADLIRTSMFCDVTDILAEDELHFLANMEQTCYDAINQDDVSSHSYNFLEFVARTSDSVDEIASDQTARLQTTPQTVDDVIAQQTTYSHDNATPPHCCHGSIITTETCEDFLSRVVQASRVDFSAFNSINPEEIFGNDYLQPIVDMKESDACLDQQKNEDAELKSSSYTHTRPLYSYAACAVTAIYLSGKDSLSVDQIVDQLCIMFDEVNNVFRRMYRKRLSKVLKEHTLFRKRDDGSFYVVPGRVSRNTFHRQVCSDEERSNKYARMIYHHFEVPSMLDDLGIEIRHKDAREKRKRTKVVPRTKDTSSTNVVSSTKVSELLRNRRSQSSVMAEGHSQSVKSTSDLKMPDRPCFHDNSDNEADEMLTQNTRIISPVSLTSSENSTIVVSNESRSSFQDTNTCMNFGHGVISTESVSNVLRRPSVVVPVPRYAVPTPSACIPLRCQAYHIPNVGTFQLVDMYYNGQVIHQLFPK